MFKLDIPKVFCVPVTTKCHLRCSFCFNSDEFYSTAEHQSLEEFKGIIDWLVSQKVEYIDITPAVGEALLIPNLEEYLDYLDNSSIRKYKLITSLAYKNINMLLDRPKLDLELSLYAGTRAGYTEATGRDILPLVIENLKKLYKVKLGVIKRFKEPIIDTTLNTILKFPNYYIIEGYAENRALKYTEKGIPRKCIFMNEPLVSKGKVSLCCMDYKLENLIIGKVGDSLKEIYTSPEIRCSDKCDWFKEWQPDNGLD